MDKRYYDALDETLYRTVLPNGLRVFVDPKPGFSKKVCYFAVDFGSIHRKFTFEGKNYAVPAGIAHYLEHRLFDLPERDVTAEFAAMGAMVNAFTGFDHSMYYISCTENFPQALKLLLEFVSKPYFTAEGVARERGIIEQEIRMAEDEPDTRLFESLVEVLYARHPIRVPVLGTPDTIANVTPELLALCHKAFYTPENMVLCVVGDVDAQQVCDIARQVLGDEKRPGAQKGTWQPENRGCIRPYTEQRMEVSMPSFAMAFKMTPSGRGEEAFRRGLIGELAAETLFGESSPLYMDLYERGLIDGSFDGGFETADGCAMLLCSGDSDAPRAVHTAILSYGEKLLRNGIDEDALLRSKRSALGRRIRALDSFGETCFRICEHEMLGADYFRFPQIYDTITTDEVHRFLHESLREDECALSVIRPIEEVMT